MYVTYDLGCPFVKSCSLKWDVFFDELKEVKYFKEITNLKGLII